jgi:hypothetical protein
LLLAACSTGPQSATDPAATGSGSQRRTTYRTFAIAPLPFQSPASDPAAAVRLADVARGAVVESLSAKGFRETDPGSADFIVKGHTEFARDPLIESSEIRLLTIAFHDRATDEVIWSNQFGRSSSKTLDPETLRKSLIELLAGVPSVLGR